MGWTAPPDCVPCRRLCWGAGTRPSRLRISAPRCSAPRSPTAAPRSCWSSPPTMNRRHRHRWPHGRRLPRLLLGRSELFVHRAAVPAVLRVTTTRKSRAVAAVFLFFPFLWQPGGPMWRVVEVTKALIFPLDCASVPRADVTYMHININI